MKGLLNKPKLSDLVSKYIRDNIISGKIKSGDRIVETSIARVLGVSQAPVREALRELEVMGLVKIVPYSGSFVVPIDKKKLLHVYSLRTMLESIAAEQGAASLSAEAVERMEKYLEKMRDAAKTGDVTALIENDVLFHREIVRAADNSMLEKMWNLIGAPHWSSLTVSVQPNLKFWADSHEELLRLVRKGSTAELVEELKKHFERASSAIIDSMDEDKEFLDKSACVVCAGKL